MNERMYWVAADQMNEERMLLIQPSYYGYEYTVWYYWCRSRRTSRRERRGERQKREGGVVIRWYVVGNGPLSYRLLYYYGV